MRKNIFKTRFLMFLTVPLMFVLLSACQDATLHQASSYLDKIASSEKLLTDTVLQMNKLGTLSDDETRPIMLMVVKIENAREQSSLITRKLNKLNPDARLNLYDIIYPIAQSLDANTIEQLSGVKNPNSRAELKKTLLAIQVTINSLLTLFNTFPNASIIYSQQESTR